MYTWFVLSIIRRVNCRLDVQHKRCQNDDAFMNTFIENFKNKY